jgi:hypothetical protein
MLIGAENRRIAIAVKAAPANGKPSLAFVMAPAQVQIRLFTGWYAAEDISAVYMQVSSGPQYGPSEARFMDAVGLSTICPEKIVQESGKGGMGPLYRLEDPTTLEQLAAMPTLAAQLPPATT